MIDVNPNHLETITRILAAHVPECEVRAFGSRVTWTAKDYSDLDLAVVWARPLDPDVLRRMKEAFETSNLPFRVDVLDWHAISAAFQKVIEKKYEVVQKGEKKSLGMSEARLADLCEAIVDCSHSTPIWTDSGALVLRSQNIRNGRLDLSDRSYTDEPHFAERTRRATPTGGDLVITREAPMGEICMIPSGLRCCLGQRLVLLRPDRTRTDPRYLLYALQSKTVQYEIGVNEGTGSTVSNLRIPLLERLPIPTRPLPEQHAIAHILGTLDDKIELNRRMNETLEAMARALFKSWFVDFDPVRAKAEGRDPGLPKPLADLFPDSFEDSNLGEIPKGWRYRQLGELVDLTRGKTYKSSLKGLPGPVLLGLASIERNGGFRDDKLSTYGGDSPSNLILVPGDLYASLKDVTQSADLLGAVARVPASVAKGRLTQDTVKLSFRTSKTSPKIVYHTLLTTQYRDFCRSHATGTTNLGLSREDFLAYPVVEPGESVRQAFDVAIENMDSRAFSAVSERQTLAALRDALLPKLISGELRVKDIERFIKGAIA